MIDAVVGFFSGLASNLAPFVAGVADGVIKFLLLDWLF